MKKRCFLRYIHMCHMPALFIGHGSPMNALELNNVTKQWRDVAIALPIPKAIVVISAHWQTVGTKVTISEELETIYDFYGFPRELYEIKYPAKGAVDIAKMLLSHYGGAILSDDLWGLDHGAWSVLVHLFPTANIPVIQLSLDRLKGLREHFEFAKTLMFLREQGVLVVGSGNIVHNLQQIDFSENAKPKPWAEEFNTAMKEAIRAEDFETILAYESFGQIARYAVPTDEHFLPLLYILALKEESEENQFFADEIQYGSLSMTALRIG